MSLKSGNKDALNDTGLSIKDSKLSTKTKSYGLPTAYNISQKLISHLDTLDGKIDDLSSPLLDIYSHEFFFYCFLTKDRKAFVDSKEGYTYIKSQQEARQTQKVMNFLYGEKDRDIPRWLKQVKTIIRKIKINPADEQEVDFVDVDALLKLYMQEYFALRKKIQKNIIFEFKNFMSSTDEDICVEQVNSILQLVVPPKHASPILQFANTISFTRAYIYGIVCGSNDNVLKSDQFLVGCNRFGIDSPCPQITKRMGAYGNQDEMDKDFKRLVAKYKEKNPEVVEGMDPDIHAIDKIVNDQMALLMSPMGLGNDSMSNLAANPKQILRFDETELQSPSKKMSGIINLQFLKNSPLKTGADQLNQKQIDMQNI